MGCYVNQSELAFPMRFYVGRNWEKDDQRRLEKSSIEAALRSFHLSRGLKEKKMGSHVIN